MLTQKFQLLLIILVLVSSCQVDDSVTLNDTVAVSTDFSVSSKAENGFSFETLSVMNDSSNQNINADFIIFPQLDEKGKLLTPFLVQPLLKSSYAFSKQFDNLKDAKQYFDDYTAIQINDLTFRNTAISVKPFQIWIVKTNKNIYGKILISATSAADISNSPQVIVNFYADRL